jgi:radical SAM protein (TIGR04043 family)
MRDGTMNSDIADLKTQLLCSGIRLPEKMRTGRRGGAGPAGGRYVIIENTLVNVPIYGAALTSPFSVSKNGTTYFLNDGPHEVKIIEDPQFYQLKTEAGISYKKIALLHGIDCLATTVYQKCIRWRKNPCSFCGIELSLEYGSTIERKTPEQLLEVAQAAIKEGVSHVTLTTGTPNETDKGAFILAESASALKGTELPVHVQLEPVKREYLELLRDSGSDTIGIHIETLDENLFKKICPLKNFSEFRSAWREAIDIFGTANVSSYVLVGLGEDDEKMLSGIEEMVRIGVIPYVVPFRPLPGTRLETHPVPPFKTVKRYSLFAAEKMKEYGIDPFENKAGCVRCGACSSVKDYIRTL